MADTHDSRRHIHLAGQANFRDLGGYLQDGLGLSQKESSQLQETLLQSA
jgi:hypothetical protein